MPSVMVFHPKIYVSVLILENLQPHWQLLAFSFLSIIGLLEFIYIYTVCLIFNHIDIIKETVHIFFSVFIKTLSQTGQRELQRGAKQT